MYNFIKRVSISHYYYVKLRRKVKQSIDNESHLVLISLNHSSQKNCYFSVNVVLQKWNHISWTLLFFLMQFRKILCRPGDIRVERGSWRTSFYERRKSETYVGSVSNLYRIILVKVRE